MSFALKVILALVPKDRALLIGLCLILTPIVLICVFFSGPVVIHERVPMATPGQAFLYFNAAKAASDHTKSPCDEGVKVNWQEVIAIDAVRLKQNFKKASPERASELAYLFTEKVGECTHCTDSGDEEI